MENQKKEEIEIEIKLNKEVSRFGFIIFCFVISL